MYMHRSPQITPRQHYIPVERRRVIFQPQNRQSVTVPRVDISEDKINIYFDFELPGLKKEDIDIRINNENVLTLNAKKYFANNSGTSEEEEKKFHEFKRSFKLDGEFEEENIKARYENGVLYVSVPKRIPAEKEISIN